MPITIFPEIVSTQIQTSETNINNNINTKYNSTISAITSQTNTLLAAISGITATTVKAVYHGSKTFLYSADATAVAIGGTVVVNKSVIFLQVQQAGAGAAELIAGDFVTARFNGSPTATTMTFDHRQSITVTVRFTVVEFY